MILYTPLSESDIFPSEEDAYLKHQMLSHEGRVLSVEQMEDGSYRLLQLISTDPQDYLRADYTPGSILS